MKNRSMFVAGGLFCALLLTASCAANKKLTKENEDLTSSLTATRARVSELEGELRAKDREIEDLQAQIQGKSEEAGNLEIRITDLEEEITALEDTMRSSGDAHQKLFAELNDQVRTLKDDLDTAQKRNEQLAAQIVEQTSQLERLQSERGELQKRVDTMNAALATMSSENEGLKQRNVVLEDELHRLQLETKSDKERMEETYNQLLSSLKEEVDQKTVEVQRYKDALTINIMNHIFFDSGKANIKPKGYSVLDRIAPLLKGFEDKIIKIEGHTDDVPIGPKIKSKYPTNWELGAARASAVARYFIGKHGVDPVRIVVVSYSLYRPILPNTSEANRAKNRRIEIVLTKRELLELMEVDKSLVVE